MITATFDRAEIQAMSDLVGRRFGPGAHSVALFFAQQHRQINDHSRANAWTAVAAKLVVHTDPETNPRLS